MGYLDCAISLLSLVGSYLYSSHENTVHWMPETEVHPILQTGSDTVYEEWVQPSAPTYARFYLFNVTNADDIVKNNAKPNLHQLGPYTYRVHYKKVNITFHNNNTVSYEQLKWYVYEPKESVGSLADSITTLNFPLVGLASDTEGKLTLFGRLGINNVMRIYESTLFMTKTVDELLFAGYVDALMAYLAKKKGDPAFPIQFGFFYGMNYTSDGIYNIYTGEDDVSKFLQIAEWQHASSLSYWNHQYCDLLRGTDGSGFTPPITQDDTLWMYSSDTCRSLYLKYKDTTDVHSLRTYRFTVPFSAIAAPELHEENKCFCSEDKGCLLSGALSLAKCRKGFPAVITLPHFYQCDERYFEAVNGMERDVEAHQTFFDIEPVTGAVLRSAKRIQVNIHLKPFSHINILKNASDIIFPVLWTDEQMIWSKDQADEFIQQLKINE